VDPRLPVSRGEGRRDGKPGVEAFGQLANDMGQAKMHADASLATHQRALTLKAITKGI
jgi:hypothetical protein